LALLPPDSCVAGYGYCHPASQIIHRNTSPTSTGTIDFTVTMSHFIQQGINPHLIHSIRLTDEKSWCQQFKKSINSMKPGAVIGLLWEK